MLSPIFHMCLWFAIVHSSPIAIESSLYSLPESLHPRDVVNTDAQCLITGNSDFYGLGIRLGVYLQWITSLIANRYIEDEIDSNLDTNTIFLFALFVALAVATAQSSFQSSVEIVVLLQLCFGFIFSVVSIWGLRTRTQIGKDSKRYPLLGSFVRLSMATLLSSYGVWFWFSGLEHFSRPGCPTFTFLLVKVDISSAAQVFYKIQSIFVILPYGVLFLNELFLVVWFYVSELILLSGGIFIATVLFASTHRWPRKRLFRVLLRKCHVSVLLMWARLNGAASTGPNRPPGLHVLLRLAQVWLIGLWALVHFLCLFLTGKSPFPNRPWLISERVFDRLLELPHLSDSRSRSFHQAISAVNLINLAWMIAAVELTLVWNQVQDIYSIDSTGQLIPFVIGIISFLRLLEAISVQRSRGKATDSLMTFFDYDNEIRPSETTDDALEQQNSYLNTDPKLGDENNPMHTVHVQNYEGVFKIQLPERRHSSDLPSSSPMMASRFENDLNFRRSINNLCDARKFEPPYRIYAQVPDPASHIRGKVYLPNLHKTLSWIPGQQRKNLSDSTWKTVMDAVPYKSSPRVQLSRLTLNSTDDIDVISNQPRSETDSTSSQHSAINGSSTSSSSIHQLEDNNLAHNRQSRATKWLLKRTAAALSEMFTRFLGVPKESFGGVTEESKNGATGTSEPVSKAPAIKFPSLSSPTTVAPIEVTENRTTSQAKQRSSLPLRQGSEISSPDAPFPAALREKLQKTLKDFRPRWNEYHSLYGRAILSGHAIAAVFTDVAVICKIDAFHLAAADMLDLVTAVQRLKAIREQHLDGTYNVIEQYFEVKKIRDSVRLGRISGAFKAWAQSWQDSHHIQEIDGLRPSRFRSLYADIADGRLQSLRPRVDD